MKIDWMRWKNSPDEGLELSRKTSEQHFLPQKLTREHTGESRREKEVVFQGRRKHSVLSFPLNPISSSIFSSLDPSASKGMLTLRNDLRPVWCVNSQLGRLVLLLCLLRAISIAIASHPPFLLEGGAA